jgi:hypothetical protein
VRRALPGGAALLLALTACGSREGAKAPDRAASPAGNAASQLAEAPAAAPVAASAVTARRCGWLHNPTPGNWWLVDGQGEWVLAEQGGHQAEGMDDVPDMEAYGWQETNGHYGYGCACIDVTAGPGGTVTRIARVQPKPLKQCRADKALPRP